MKPVGLSPSHYSRGRSGALHNQKAFGQCWYYRIADQPRATCATCQAPGAKSSGCCSALRNLRGTLKTKAGSQGLCRQGVYQGSSPGGDTFSLYTALPLFRNRDENATDDDILSSGCYRTVSIAT